MLVSKWVLVYHVIQYGTVEINNRLLAYDQYQIDTVLQSSAILNDKDHRHSVISIYGVLELCMGNLGISGIM